MFHLRLMMAAALAMIAAPVLAQDRFKAVTTFTVIADMARNVAGDVADVESITRPGAEIHDYQPTPRDLIRAQDADLILWNGLELEAWFAQFFANLRDLPDAVVTDGITPIAIASGDAAGAVNPHAWMGLENALIYVDNIRDAFALHDPDHAAIYAANAEIYKDQIIATIAPLRDAIMALPEDQRWLVTCEGAFSYLAADFGLRELYLWPINADQMGSPQQIRQVIDTVRENDISTVFCESTVNPAPAQQVARETGASFGGVLYVDSLTEADGAAPTYLDMLRVTAQTILEGLAR
jgi:manganese/iron transport system substrate-binding protein